MSLHLYMAFVLASAIAIFTPGPTVLMVIADAMAHHKRHAWSTVLGVGAGDIVGMVVSLAGVGVVVRTSAVAFTIVKIVGGLYLIYLGGRSIYATRNREMGIETLGESMATKSARARFSSAFLVTVTNPKLILFFVAFVPQFISPARSFVEQSAVYIATFDVMAMVNASAYAFAARSVGAKLTSAENQKRVGWVSGAILVMAGVIVLVVRFHA